MPTGQTITSHMVPNLATHDKIQNKWTSTEWNARNSQVIDDLRVRCTRNVLLIAFQIKTTHTGR